MRKWESFLKVSKWTSQYESVSNFLGHYKRRLGSKRTKDQICDNLMAFCDYAKKNPDELIELDKNSASRLLQRYVDSLADKDYSIRTVNVRLAYLKMFFVTNGFKAGKELEVERHHQPARYRKRPEYVPTSEEIFKMVYSAGSVRNKALVMALYTCGLRNSTIRSVLYQDVKDELQKFDVVMIPVYPEMKKVDDGACKGNIPYYSFISKETVSVLRSYLNERKVEYGSIMDSEPLFASTSTNVARETRRKTTVKRRSLSEIVKRAARKAGIERWKAVYPHCLRKAFESALRNSGMDVKDQEFLMGHILPGVQDTYYDKTKTEDLRQRYKRVIFFPERGIPEEQRKRQILDTVKLLGYSDDKIKRVEEALAKYKNIDDGLDEIKKLSLKSTEEQKSTPNKS